MTDVVTQAPARALSPEEAEERAEHCFKLEETIKSGLRAGREAMWDVAAALHEFDEENGFTALGHDSLGDWLADPEVAMSRATYFRMVQAYRETVIQRQIPEQTVKSIDYTKVQIVLPAVKAGRVKINDALDDAKELGARDLRTRYMKRPDPVDGLDSEPQDNAKATSTPLTPKPVLAPDDEPVLASDVEPEPAQNDDDALSGQVQYDDEVERHRHEPEVIEGSGRDITVNVPDGKVIPVKYARGIAKLVAEARTALALPDRQAPDRRAKREALENLIIGLEAAGLA